MRYELDLSQYEQENNGDRQMPIDMLEYPAKTQKTKATCTVQRH